VRDGVACDAAGQFDPETEAGRGGLRLDRSGGRRSQRVAHRGERLG
jgi:hypothetical protein